jgi:hypothetical protein
VLVIGSVTPDMSTLKLSRPSMFVGTFPVMARAARCRDRRWRSGHEIRRARPRRGYDNARPAGDARVAVGRMACALLVAGRVMRYFIAVFVKFIVDVDDKAAGIAEYGVDTLFDESFDQNLRACE